MTTATAFKQAGDDFNALLANAVRGVESAMQTMHELENKRDALNADIKEMASAISETRAVIASEMREAGVITQRVMVGNRSYRLSVSDGRQSVNVTDAQLVPRDYKRPRVEPDKAAIRKALMDGADIPGAELVTGDPVLTIKPEDN